MKSLLRLHLKGLLVDWRTYASFIVPLVFLLILGSFEGEAQTIATIVASSVLTVSLFRLKGAFDRFNKTSLNKGVNLMYHFLQIVLVYLLFTLILVFIFETWFILWTYIFTEIVDIMNGFLIRPGDINWNYLNWWSIYWTIFLATIVDTSIAFFVYSISVHRNLFNSIAFSWIFLSIIMNLFFGTYLSIDVSDSTSANYGMYYVSFGDSWVNYFWFIFPNFWSNSAALMNFKTYGKEFFVYNPFLIGNAVDDRAIMFQKLFIVMPWVWTGFLISAGTINYNWVKIHGKNL